MKIGLLIIPLGLAILAAGPAASPARAAREAKQAPAPDVRGLDVETQVLNRSALQI